MPEISIIIPNYNHGLFLKRRIDSVLAQTFTDYELIILDDCSTDNSCEIIESYRSNPKVSQIEFNTKNSGNTFLQWQKGISISKGKYIWIAESDDWCEPTLLQELYEPLSKNVNLVIGFCQSIYVDSSDRIIWKTQNNFIKEIVDGPDFAVKNMMATNAISNASMVLFRKDVTEKADPAYTKMKYCGDWLFWTSICFSGKLFISGKYLNYYFRHGNNVATNSEMEGHDFLEGNLIFKYILERQKVDRETLLNALELKLKRYSQIEMKFKSEEVRTKVRNSILELHPLVKKTWLKHNIDQSVRKSLFRIKKLIFQH
jgi:glycosyltransferase involved in cell wall biosynthesis